MRREFALFAALLVTIAPIRAHHGSAGFDQNRPLHFTGKVSQVEWSNPHIVVRVEASNATWLVNTLPPNTAKRLGFTQNDFAPGVEVTVDGYQATDGSNHVNGTSIRLPGGKQITSAACFEPSPYCFGSAALK